MTRATLLTAPYRTADGRFGALANVERPGPGVAGEMAFIAVEDASDLSKGAVITVKRDGNEWRAG